jgi:hypothetical protein
LTAADLVLIKFGVPGKSGLNGLLSSEAFALHLKP